MKKTLIINYPSLNVGGIEQYIFKLVTYAQKMRYRTVWICDKRKIINPIYNSIMRNIEVYVVKDNRYSKEEYEGLTFCTDECVSIICFSPFEMSESLKIKRLNPNVSISTFYIVANAKGRFYYLEDNFLLLSKKIVKKKMQSVMKNWVANHYVYFFTQKQMDSFINTYNVVFYNPEKLFLPSITQVKAFSEEAVRNKCKRDQFNIVTVSRFSFPHKNYLLGLINDFAKLKKKYSQLRLHIIGYGEGQKKINELIGSLPFEIRESITLYGEQSSEEISEIMKSMHLNISVAGSVSCGAINSVVSIPARNFCVDYECQVYGWLPQSKALTTALEPGESCIPYIEKVINMSDEEYVEACKLSHKAYENQSINPEFVFQQDNHSEEVKEEININWSLLHFFSECFWKLKLILHLGE